MTSEPLLAPSILAGDLADLKGVAAACAEGGADLLHVDVMDGHFVPNLTFGIPVMEALAAATDLPMDVHLMVSNPERLLDEYVAAGAQWLAIHQEATVHLDRAADRIRSLGAKAGVALNPATPVAVLEDILPALDYVMLMSVNPGFAGQRFIPYVLEKARRLQEMIEARGAATVIGMDGGIGESNIAEAAAAGTGLFVAGSAVFAAADPVAAMKSLKERARGSK